MIRASLEEIRTPTLRWTGLALTGVHVLTFLLWFTPLLGPFQNAVAILYDDMPVCWPFFEACGWTRPVFANALTVIAALYLLLGLGGLFFFATNKTRAGFVALATLTLIKAVLTLQDYRLAGNFHSMAFVVTLIYLLLPRKIPAMKLAIVGFYLLAALLKFNREWLSGAAIGERGLFSGKVFEWALAYVVTLEIVIAPLLLSRSSRVFWFAFAQIAVFHAVSWIYVGPYYPLVMFSLLTIFLWDRRYGPEPLRLSPAAVAALTIYAAAQLPLFFPQSAVTGEGRLLALVMYDAQTDCRNLLVTKKGASRAITELPRPNVMPRIQCDPVVYAAALKKECLRARDGAFDDFDFALLTRRTSDDEFQTVMNLRDVCTHPPSVSFLGKVRQ